MAFDLATDPGEERPKSAEGHPLRVALDPLVSGAMASGGQGAAMTPEMIEALRAVGYVQ
jgi:hypothetical protein